MWRVEVIEVLEVLCLKGENIMTPMGLFYPAWTMDDGNWKLSWKKHGATLRWDQGHG